MVKAQSKSGKSREINANGLYLFFISRDLKKIIDLIVPEGRQGLPNLISTKQVRFMDIASSFISFGTFFSRL